jgi:hypothetical protein
MLRNYDPLVQEVDALREALGRLHDNASEDAEATAAIDRFATAAALQEQLTEQFKSDNAIAPSCGRTLKPSSIRSTVAA